jgi:uncharacterized membrane protein
MKSLLLAIVSALLILGQSVANADDWISYYYRNPTPDRFIEEVTALSNQGILGDETKTNLIGVFLSQIILSNQEEIPNWMKQLKDLPESDQNSLRMALWLSNSPGAKSYLTSIGEERLAINEPPNILEYEPDSPEILDMWWAYFLATGEKEPVRNIISAFQYGDYIGALEAYNSSSKTEEDEIMVIHEMTFESARWSLESNMRQHKRVADICEEIFSYDELSHQEKLWLGAILVKVFPGKYVMTKIEGGQRIEKIK